MHEEKDSKAKDGDVVKEGAVPAYLLDRQNVSRAKVVISTLHNLTQVRFLAIQLSKRGKKELESMKSLFPKFAPSAKMKCLRLSSPERDKVSSVKPILTRFREGLEAHGN